MRNPDKYNLNLALFTHAIPADIGEQYTHTYEKDRENKRCRDVCINSANSGDIPNATLHTPLTPLTQQIRSHCQG